MTLNFTLLSEEQIWGDDALDVMKKYGTKVAPTDLAILLGVGTYNSRTSENDPACFCWYANENQSPHCVDCFGDKIGPLDPAVRYCPARPALPPSEVSKINPKEVRTLKSGVRIVEYGEYPQTLVDKRTSRALERLYGLKSSSSKRKYTFDSADEKGHGGDDTPFRPKSYREYQLDGKRYIRINGYGPRYDNEHIGWTCLGQASNGEVLYSRKPYWIEVQPIEWLMDKSGWMVAKKCLFASIQYHPDLCYKGEFSKTFMKHYLDTYFAKQMMPIERVVKHSKTKIGKIALKKRQVTR